MSFGCYHLGLGRASAPAEHARKLPSSPMQQPQQPMRCRMEQSGEQAPSPPGSAPCEGRGRTHLRGPVEGERRVPGTEGGNAAAYGRAVGVDSEAAARAIGVRPRVEGAPAEGGPLVERA